MRLKLLVPVTLALFVLALGLLELTGKRAAANPQPTTASENATPSKAPGVEATSATGAAANSTAVQPAVATPKPPDEVLYEGVWNKGQAASWDMKEIDLFSPFPQGYRPEQPIKFSHVVHVQKAGMECTYCHSGVNKSGFATIPSVESCMGCHAQVKTDSPEIKKLKKYYDEKKPVEWVPVSNLPEHAHFNHERHIKAGVGCQSCHGQVHKMDVVEKASSLKMGFCIDCHRHKGATIDCAACHY